MGHSSRRGRRGEFFSQVQDPGKDLFAYLFLVMLIFSFVILVTYEEKIRGQGVQKSPRVTSAGTSSLVSLKEKEIGRLIKKEGTVLLLFGTELYRPAEDLELLEKRKIIKTGKDETGKQTKTIYIEEDPQSKIYLGEYLEVFKNLSDQGINISFVQKVK